MIVTGWSKGQVEGGPRGRHAPSPTGRLHLGNARTALLTWLDLRSRGGRVVLRPELVKEMVRMFGEAALRRAAEVRERGPA